MKHSLRLLFALCAILVMASPAHAFYDAVLGRFATRDPIGEYGGTNLYRYVGNNPVNLTDPRGLQAEPPGEDSARGGGAEILLGPGARAIVPDPPLPEPPAPGRGPEPVSPGDEELRDPKTPEEPVIEPGASTQCSSKNLPAPAQPIYVIGRLPDTKVAENWPGYKVLNIPDWSLSKNDAWIDGIIKDRAPVYIASPLNFGNLWDAEANRPTVLSREYDRLSSAGYTLNGDFMSPPPAK